MKAKVYMMCWLQGKMFDLVIINWVLGQARFSLKNCDKGSRELVID